MKREYSTRGSAVRMRRMRMQRKAREAEQIGLLLNLKNAPKVITWHCGCGSSFIVFELSTVKLDRWTEHRRSCLFTREAFPEAVERKTEGAL